MSIEGAGHLQKEELGTPPASSSPLYPTRPQSPSEASNPTAWCGPCLCPLCGPWCSCPSAWHPGSSATCSTCPTPGWTSKCARRVSLSPGRGGAEGCRAPRGGQAHWPFLPASRCLAESLSGEEQCSSSAPGAPKAQPATPGLGRRLRAIQESVGKVGAGGGGLPLRAGGLESECRPVLLTCKGAGQVPALPWACFLTCEWEGWASQTWVTLEGFVSQGWLGAARLGAAAGGVEARWRRGLLRPLDGEAQVQSGDVTYFPRPPAFPCGSFLVAQALLEGDASPHGGLCHGARWRGAGRFVSLGRSKM